MHVKVTVVKQVSISGVGIFSKPEKAATFYTAYQCNIWWQKILAAHVDTGGKTREVDIAVLHERQVRMRRRVLPIFKRMLQKDPSVL